MAVESAPPVTPAPPRKAARGSALGRSEGARTALLLTPPMLWLGVAYLAALGALLITSLWSQNDFTGEIERIWTFDNYRQLWEIPVYRTIAFRTIGVAALVTAVDIVLAFPMALYMAIRNWRKPSSILPRTKIRFWIAAVLSALQITSWVWLFAYLIYRR